MAPTTVEARRTVALTGASGHLGRALIEDLLRRGFNVRILVHKTPVHGTLPSEVQIFYGSILSPESLSPFLRDCDYLIHSAALISLDGDKGGRVQAVNVEGTRHVLDCALRNGVRKVIHVSSIHAFNSRPCRKPLNEERDLCPPRSSAYDISKRRSQELALSYVEKGLNVSVVCPTSLIGPPDYGPSPQGKALLDIVKGKVPAVFPGGYDFLDVRDAAHAIVNALTQAMAGQAYILSGEYVTIRQLVEWVHEFSGRRKLIPTIPFIAGYTLLPFLGLWSKLNRSQIRFTREILKTLQHSPRLVDSSKARKELGLQPRPIRESVHDTLKWFLENNLM
ncbi:MAG: NAD-dependent epimerase/dehydratase family protein [Flavobacteriales bacterium]|nr:NAD-dependent epimerase/dehydratase family protein [Flavobacteriales bacterium]MCX7767620.1 NAD-dependent epimerase/dehydratase family protein [Flavobacteriales bacterium]MDW8409538.1 NAD-dependent epimerase/dehydratase family protein [Flavobacteriales bacterium]